MNFYAAVFISLYFTISLIKVTPESFQPNDFFAAKEVVKNCPGITNGHVQESQARKIAKLCMDKLPNNILVKRAIRINHK